MIGRKKKHTSEEIVGRLRQVEVLNAVRTIGVAEPTSYRWRAEYGDLKLDQVKRLKEVE